MFDEDQLTPAEREFEAALRSLRPVPAQVAPVTNRVRKRKSSRALRYWGVAAAVAVLAGTTWMAMSLREERSGIAHQASRTQHVVGADLRSSIVPATLLAYRQALAKSSADFEALLNHQAAVGTALQNTDAQLTMSTLRTTNFQPLQGKM